MVFFRSSPVQQVHDPSREQLHMVSPLWERPVMDGQQSWTWTKKETQEQWKIKCMISFGLDVYIYDTLACVLSHISGRGTCCN